MSKGIVPIELLVRGNASAYSSQEIIDRVDKYWSGISEALFDKYLPYHLRAKDMIDSSGTMMRSDLKKLVIDEFKENDVQLLNKFLGKLQVIARSFEDSKGIIFFDSKKALNAAHDLNTLINEVKEWRSQETQFEKYYQNRAETFLDKTIENWDAKMVLADDTTAVPNYD